MTTVIPVIINQPARECTIIDGHRYCRDESMTSHDIGIVSLVMIGIFLWAMSAGWALTENHLLLAAIIFFAPFLLGALFIFA